MPERKEDALRDLGGCGILRFAIPTAREEREIWGTLYCSAIPQDGTEAGKSYSRLIDLPRICGFAVSLHTMLTSRKLYY
jgi:hypothetical protein